MTITADLIEWTATTATTATTAPAAPLAAAALAGCGAPAAPGRDAASPRPVLAAREVARTVAGHARAAEQDRSLHPAAAEATRRGGFARHFTPVRWGGAGGGFAELLEPVATVAQACAAAGWWSSLQAAHARLAALLPVEAQRDLWAEGPDVPLAAAVAESGGLAAADGEGWRLTGRWRYASGVDHARWVLLAADTPGPDGPRSTVFLVPREQVEIESRWAGDGLRGSGTHAIAVHDVRIPGHRAVARDAVLAGARRGSFGVEPCHQVPVMLVAALLFAAPCVGVARSALSAWSTSAPAGPEVLARSAAEIDAAALLLARAAERADAPGEHDRLALATNRRDCAVAVDLLVCVVERLYLAADPADRLEGGALERARRDLRTIASHAMLRLGPAAAAYAEAAAIAA